MNGSALSVNSGSVWSVTPSIALAVPAPTEEIAQAIKKNGIENAFMAKLPLSGSLRRESATVNPPSEMRELSIPASGEVFPSLPQRGFTCQPRVATLRGLASLPWVRVAQIAATLKAVAFFIEHFGIQHFPQFPYSFLEKPILENKKRFAPTEPKPTEEKAARAIGSEMSAEHGSEQLI